MLALSDLDSSDSTSSLELLHSILDASLTGIIFFKPLYNESRTEIIDLAYAGLNRAAQEMLNLPEKPIETFLTLYPNAVQMGIFAFYRDSYLSGERGRYDINYSYDGLDNYFNLSAKRSGSVLVVNFTDTAEQERSKVEKELRESQAREIKARAEINLERQQLYSILMQAPALICIFEGPDHVFKLVNPPYQRLVGDRPILGLPIAVAMPELKGQPIFGLLDKVYQTGESYFAHEMMVQLDHENSGGLGKNYYNFIYQAIRDVNQVVTSILVFAYEVTAQVTARTVVEKSRKEIQALNEDLAAVNEELVTNNTELQRTQKLLEQLNVDLEQRVKERTQDARAAKYESERQRARLERFFMQAPASICILNGPDLVYELVNPGYQQLFPGRELLHKPISEALPEIVGHEVHKGFIRVFETGVTIEEQGLLIPIARPSDGVLEDRYFKYIQQARYDDDGKIDGVMVFAFEVTLQMQAKLKAEQSERQAQILAQEVAAINEELRAANEEIQSTNEELGIANRQLMRTNVDLDTFIYTASHDLKAPVSNIEGLLETLRDELEMKKNKITTETEYILGLMETSINRFKETILDLTEISKVQKLQDEDVEIIKIPQIMDDIQISIHDMIKESNAAIRVNFSKVDIMSFSKKNFKSILYNLVSNAIKYRDESRPLEIDIETENQEEFILLAVTDNGSGISKDNQEKMFTMFKRFHSHVEGSGIGLYIVKRLVDNSGGKIEVESEQGKGTAFKVYFKK